MMEAVECYLPVCTHCSKLIDEQQRKAIVWQCGHLYCGECSGKKEVCEVDGERTKDPKVATELKERIIELKRAWGSDEEFTSALGRAREAINVHSVRCHYTEKGQRCPILERCCYDHSLPVDNLQDSQSWQCSKCSVAVDDDFCPFCDSAKPNDGVDTGTHSAAAGSPAGWVRIVPLMAAHELVLFLLKFRCYAPSLLRAIL